jgi:hypothetical protein
LSSTYSPPPLGAHTIRSGGDGDEEALEIALSRVEIGILQLSKMKIAMPVALWTS